MDITEKIQQNTNDDGNHKMMQQHGRDKNDTRRIKELR